jgi:hypothetical protein
VQNSMQKTGRKYVHIGRLIQAFAASDYCNDPMYDAPIRISHAEPSTHIASLVLAPLPICTNLDPA